MTENCMNQYQGISKRILLIFSSLIASTALATSPSQAATFALSEGVLDFTKFSQSPLTVGTDVDTDTLAIANNNMVGTLADAEANFIVVPPKASSLSLSQAFGSGNRAYLGLAESEAKLIGNFVVDAGTPFSFDFTTSLKLEVSVDNPLLSEKASASGDISFVLLDTANQSVLDFFNVVGDLSTVDNKDFIAFQKSENVSLNNPVTQSNFGGNQEFAQVNLQGSLQRTFANKTNLTLIEVKRNKARVEVPEPSSGLALLVLCGVTGITLKCRRKAATSAKSLEIKVVNEV
jgi:hypothetical protein